MFGDQSIITIFVETFTESFAYVGLRKSFGGGLLVWGDGVAAILLVLC